MGRSKRKKQGKRSSGTRRSFPVEAKKYLGQHFLKSEEIAAKIADTLTYKGYKNLMEIGPGTGVLTKYLLDKPVRLAALELDRESIDYLETVFTLEHATEMATNNSFEIVQGDFLKFDVLSYFDHQPFAVIGNFPYNISTQILFKVIDLRAYVPEFAGMFQKEVAQRICAKEGNKIYGILSVLVQAFYETEYLFTVPPEVFVPPPKVESAVIRLRRRPELNLPCDEKLFFKVVKSAFNQRRKTLRNSLKTFGLSDNLKEDAIFDQRPEQLAVADFITLTEQIAHDTV
ncbi:MAG: 16S rRNA (adenine(1518)-N(6)/adenine(1519)-N(6))-dimethyltransferase RsmA [Flavobacteriaceae bacterium]